MNYSYRLSISYYKTVAPINDPHNVYLVQHRETGKFYVRKILEVYSADVYENLYKNPVPGIPGIVDYYEEDGRLTLIEEFIPGKTLREVFDEARVTGGVLTKEKIGHYMMGLCEIVDRLHSMQPPIIHRDVKPSNIIVTAYDNVYLLDYNAARHFRADTGQESDTRLLGTQGYAAPEQYGFGQSSPMTDIYSLGKILKEAVLCLSCEEHAFDRIIEKCTQIDPAKRFAGAGQLCEALRKCLESSSRSDLSAPVNPYLPPGFRTENPRKRMAAFLAYMLIFYICLTLTTDDLSGIGLWVERICFLLIVLADVLIVSDYLHIQRFAPFRESANKLLRVLGVLILLLMVTATMLLLTIFIVKAFLVKS